MINQALLSSTEIRQLVNQGRSLSFNKQSPSHAQSGEQSTQGLGHGMDFADMRPYQAGDNPKRIDWRASARRQQTLVRLYHADTNTPCCIVIDRQASMRFGSRVRSKSTQAARIAIMLAAANLEKGNALSALIIDQQSQWLKPSAEKSMLQRFSQLVSKTSPPLTETEQNQLDWKNISSQLQQHLSCGSNLYLISDFLTLDEGQSLSMQQLGKNYHCHALQIIDPLEASIKQHAKIRLQWNEKLLSANQQINAQQKIWQQQLQKILRSAQISHQLLPSDLEVLTPQLQAIHA